MLADFSGFYHHMREYLNRAYNEILFDWFAFLQKTMFFFYIFVKSCT